MDDEHVQPGAYSLNWDAQIRDFKRIHVRAYERLESYIGYPPPTGKDYLDLHTAAENGHIALVAAALEEGIDIDIRETTGSGATALHAASFHGHILVVKLLLDRGAAIDAVTHADVTALACAVVNRHYEITALLLARGAIVNAPRHVQAVVLYIAAGVGNIDVIRILLRLGLDVNTSGDCRFTTMALRAAVQGGHHRVIAVLLRNGADVHARLDDGRTPLSHAALLGRDDLFELLRVFTSRWASQAPSPLAGDVEREYLLRDAVLGGSRRIVETVIGCTGVDVNAPFRDGATPLTLATECGHRQVIELLLVRGAGPNPEARPLQ